MYIYIFRTYYFALKIILKILNNFAQYLSFISITLFITFFLLIKQGLHIYEDVFINSLKGLYPEFITPSTSLSKNLEKNIDIQVSREIFVHSEEIEFSYDGENSVTKFMNVRTFSQEYKENLFSTLSFEKECEVNDKTIWLSNRLYENIVQDQEFDKKNIYFMDEDDNFLAYNICVFHLENNEKWMLASNDTAKAIAYLPQKKFVIYTENKELKEQLYIQDGLSSWKEYIDYDDLGIFLLALHVSDTFLTTFFIFLITFMVIVFSSLAKNFSSSIFLIKLYGLNKYRSVVLFSVFFLLYTFVLSMFVYLEYSLFVISLEKFAQLEMTLNYDMYFLIVKLLLLIGFIVSIFITYKYHRLPL